MWSYSLSPEDYLVHKCSLRSLVHIFSPLKMMLTLTNTSYILVSTQICWIHLIFQSGIDNPFLGVVRNPAHSGIFRKKTALGISWIQTWYLKNTGSVDWGPQHQLCHPTVLVQCYLCVLLPLGSLWRWTFSNSAGVAEQTKSKSKHLLHKLILCNRTK